MMIETKAFTAFEYHQDTQFYPADYRYEGATEIGWKIYRENKLYLTLPRGYVLLKTLSCGICSTDISRHLLPFPLPQIIGHEVVAQSNESSEKMVVVDINASHKHIDSDDACLYCENGLENHCPDRLTLGIDRLPGGFSPYILVPINSIIPLPKNFSIETASVIEPFSAALHAVLKEDLQQGDSVAIVGPRRLGSLLILALSLWRKKSNINFTITAIIRNEQVRKLCELAGADEIKKSDFSKYDIVFDTSGSVSGFELALRLALRSIHVKSTNGQQVAGLTHLTEMVIDELSLSSLPKVIDASELNGKNIALDASLGDARIREIKQKYHQTKFTVLIGSYEIKTEEKRERVFDAAIGMTINFINNMVRDKNESAAIKPMGKLFLEKDNGDLSQLAVSLRHGVKINTSRCGDFTTAIKLLEENMSFVKRFLSIFISAQYSEKELKVAFEEAKSNRQAIKVLVRHL